MKFKIKVKSINTGNEWWEEYDKNVTDPRQWAENTMAKFNRTLRPGESSRELLEVEVLREAQDELT